MAASWHWICVEDADLALILDGPPEDAARAQLWDWVEDVQSAIEDGLETA